MDFINAFGSLLLNGVPMNALSTCKEREHGKKLYFFFVAPSFSSSEGEMDMLGGGASPEACNKDDSIDGWGCAPARPPVLLTCCFKFVYLLCSLTWVLLSFETKWKRNAPSARNWGCRSWDRHLSWMAGLMIKPHWAQSPFP